MATRTPVLCLQGAEQASPGLARLPARAQGPGAAPEPWGGSVPELLCPLHAGRWLREVGEQPWEGARCVPRYPGEAEGVGNQPSPAWLGLSWDAGGSRGWPGSRALTRATRTKGSRSQGSWGWECWHLQQSGNSRLFFRIGAPDHPSVTRPFCPGSSSRCGHGWHCWHCQSLLRAQARSALRSKSHLQSLISICIVAWLSKRSSS